MSAPMPCLVCGELTVYSTGYRGRYAGRNKKQYLDDLYVKRFRGRSDSPFDRICGKCRSEQHEIPDNVVPLRRTK
jgi:hypothetical protein